MRKWLQDKSNRATGMYLFFAVYLIGIVAAGENLALGRPVLEKGFPDFSTLYLIRTGMIAAGSLLLVHGVYRFRQGGEGLSLERREVVLGWGQFLLIGGFLLLFVVKPKIYLGLQNEDGLIENLSAWAYFLGAVLLIWLIWKMRIANNKKGGIRQIILFVLVLAYLVAGMEEVSWFQRVLSFETPAAFSENIQGEFNLHNFATDLFETAYHMLAFTFLVGLPFANLVFRLDEKVGAAAVFVPSITSILAGGLIVSHNFLRWNIYPIQFSFFLSVFVLLYLLKLGVGWKDRVLVGAVTCLSICTQLVFFFSEHSNNFKYAVVEYKEFYLAMGFLLYAVDLVFRVSRENNSIGVNGS